MIKEASKPKRGRRRIGACAPMILRFAERHRRRAATGCLNIFGISRFSSGIRSLTVAAGLRLCRFGVSCRAATVSTYRVEFLSFWQEYFRLCAFRPMFMRPRPHSENNSNFRLRPATRAWHIPLPPLRPNPGQSACPDGKPKSIQSVSRRLCASAVSSRFLRVSASPRQRAVLFGSGSAGLGSGFPQA